MPSKNYCECLHACKQFMRPQHWAMTFPIWRRVDSLSKLQNLLGMHSKNWFLNGPGSSLHNTTLQGSILVTTTLTLDANIDDIIMGWPWINEQRNSSITNNTLNMKHSRTTHYLLLTNCRRYMNHLLHVNVIGVFASIVNDSDCLGHLQVGCKQSLARCHDL